MTKFLRVICSCMAYLPWWILYGISDLAFFIIYYIARYRRKVVADNLARSFPEMPPCERQRVARGFFRNFCDVFVESVKLLHISDAEMERRMEFRHIEVMDRLITSGRSIAVYFAHTGNWEWAPSVTLHTTGDTPAEVVYGQVYRPLRNKAFDELMLRIRSRFGSQSYPKATVFRHLALLARAGRISVTGFMSDQKPSHGDPTLPLLFLNQPTAFITGTETLARRLGMGAVYWDMERLSRGRYRITCRLIADNVAALPEHECTRRYASMLQQTILRQPDIWLWTHKRWKIPVHGDVLPL